MSNCLKYNYLEPIADRNVDHTLQLYPNHTAFTHLGCVILRISIGLTVISTDLSKKQKKYVAIMFFTMALLFLFKYFKTIESPLWKSYLRSITSFTVSGILCLLGRSDMAGMLFIADSIFSIQARHTASILTSC